MLVKFEQNHIVWTIQNFELFDEKGLSIFDKVLTPFWKMFLWLKQLIDETIHIDLRGVEYEFIRYGFSLVWVLVLILIRVILEQSINNKMVSKI